MATTSRIPNYCGVKIANSLGNICAHYDYLVKKCVLDEKHMIFLTHCLFKQPQAMELVDAYFLKFEQMASSESGFYGPYTDPTYVTFAGPKSMSSNSQVSVPSVKFEHPIASLTSANATSGNVPIKIEETTTALSFLSNGIDPAVTSSAEVTHEGAETAATILPTHAAGIKVVAPIIPQGVIPRTESSTTTITEADMQAINAPVTSIVDNTEIEHIETATITVTEPETKVIDKSVSPIEANAKIATIEAPVTTAPVTAKPQAIKTPITHVAAQAEIISIDAPTTPIPSTPILKNTQAADSSSDDEDDNFDFFSTLYDREANGSIYNDPPRSVTSKKSTPTSDKFITNYGLEKFSSFLQRCDQLGIKRKISSAKDTVNDEQLATQLPEQAIAKIAAAEFTAVVEAPNKSFSEDVTATEAPIYNIDQQVVVAEAAKVDTQNPIIEQDVQPQPKPAQRGYGGVAVRYITEEGTFARDGSVEFQTVALSRGVKPERMVTRHNSGVIVETLHFARGGSTGGGPRGNMKSLKFNVGERLKIKKMLGNGWYLARKLDGDDEYSTIRIFRMETGLKIASKTKLTGDTSASASRIVVRAPSPDQDFTWVPPHLRGIDTITSKAKVESKPIIRKRYQEVLYFDGRSPRLVSETVTAVIN